mgnify:CR=1 FL=1
MEELSYWELLHIDPHPSDEWIEGWRHLPEFREFEAKLINHIKRAPRGSDIPVVPRDPTKTGWVLRIMDWWLWYSGDPDADFSWMSEDYSHLHKA